MSSPASTWSFPCDSTMNPKAIVLDLEKQCPRRVRRTLNGKIPLSPPTSLSPSSLTLPASLSVSLSFSLPLCLPLSLSPPTQRLLGVGVGRQLPASISCLVNFRPVRGPAFSRSKVGTRGVTQERLSSGLHMQAHVHTQRQKNTYTHRQKHRDRQRGWGRGKVISLGSRAKFPHQASSRDTSTSL